MQLQFQRKVAAGHRQECQTSGFLRVGRGQLYELFGSNRVKLPVAAIQFHEGRRRSADLVIEFRGEENSRRLNHGEIGWLYNGPRWLGRELGLQGKRLAQEAEACTGPGWSTGQGRNIVRAKSR